MVAKLNRKVEAKLARERAHLRPLPPKPVPGVLRPASVRASGQRKR